MGFRNAVCTKMEGNAICIQIISIGGILKLQKSVKLPKSGDKSDFSMPAIKKNS